MTDEQRARKNKRDRLRMRRLRAEDPEGMKRKAEECRQRDRERDEGAYLAKLAGKQRNFRERNPEHMRAYDRELYRKHADTKKARARAYEVRIRDQDPEAFNAARRAAAIARESADPVGVRAKFRASEHARKARVVGAPGRGVSPSECVDIMRSADGLCAYCGKRTDTLELDHIYPLVRGGAHDPDNLVVACRRCNRSKGQRPVLVWLLKRRIK